jgi:cytochrome P450
MRVISRPDEVFAALEDPAYTVPPAAPGNRGVAWLRAHVARFSEGAEHARRRALAVAILDKIDPDSLRTAPGSNPTEILATALGRPDVVADVAAVAPVYLLGENVTPDADNAVERLVEAFGGVHDEETAARIGLLVQAHAATAALVAKAEHPVPGTRRLDPDGDLVFLDFTGDPALMFGAGRHQCPGKAHALAIAAHDRLR